MSTQSTEESRVLRGRLAAPRLPRILIDPALTPFAGLLGLASVAAAFALNRSGTGALETSALFWIGLLVLLVPIAAHLLAESTSRGDRIGLVVFAALATYAVKVFHDPSAFGFSDEFIHLSVAQQVQSSHAILGASPAAGSEVAAAYPGLQTAAVALSAVSSLSLFASGLIVIAVGRVLLLLGLFLLYERISGSSRQAGIGSMLYMASANFLYFTAQFSYESLSLPLFVVVLAIGATLPGARGRARLPLLLCTILLIGAVTVTHHLTSYALAATFVALSVLSLRSAWRSTRAVALAGLSLATAGAWYAFVASNTGAYLGYVFRRTTQAVTDAASGQTRKPFETDAGLQTPIIERGIAVASAGIVCVAILYALRQLWKERQPISAPAALLIAGAIGFLALFPLKVLPGAWETANRSSDFLFIGVAFVIAALIAHHSNTRHRRLASVLLVAAVICGGLIQGWPSQLRLSQPVQARVGTTVLSAEGLAAARWAEAHLPAGSIYLADETSGRELAVLRAHRVYTGRTIEAPQLFTDTTLPRWQHDRLVEHQIKYIVLDRRKISGNNLAGYFLQPRDNPDGGFGDYPSAVRRKYERVPRSRTVYDSGDIAIIDVSGLQGLFPACSSVGARTWSDAFSCLDGGTIVRYAGADGVARMSAARIAIAGMRSESRVTGLHLTVSLLIQNLSNRPLAPDPSYSGYGLLVNGQPIARVHHTRGLRGNLGSGTQVPARRTLQRSTSFVLDHAQAQTFRRDGGVLTLRTSPTAPAERAEVARVRVMAPSRDATP